MKITTEERIEEKVKQVLGTGKDPLQVASSRALQITALGVFLSGTVAFAWTYIAKPAVVDVSRESAKEVVLMEQRERQLTDSLILDRIKSQENILNMIYQEVRKKNGR